MVLERINSAGDSIGPAWSGAIAGENATLNMVRSSISGAAAAAGAVVWGRGTANVVSSLISHSGGLSVRDDIQPGVMNLVNSLVVLSAQNSDIQRMQAFGGGELNITASSILQDVLYNTYNHCSVEPYACTGKPLTTFAGGSITLRQSVVSLINSFVPGLMPTGVLSYSTVVLNPVNPGTFIAFDNVWVQTTPNQSAADLQTLFGNAGLITSGIPLTLQDFGGVNAYLPLPHSADPAPGGPLIKSMAARSCWMCSAIPAPTTASARSVRFSPPTSRHRFPWPVPQRPWPGVGGCGAGSATGRRLGRVN